MMEMEKVFWVKLLDVVCKTMYAVFEIRTEARNIMKKIIIVAESGSDITPEIAERYNIQVVPMHVNFGEETLDDGKFPVEKIIDYYKTTGKLPKTSGSMPEDAAKVFDEIHEKWPEAHILYLAYSAATTCSLQSAMIAGEDRDYITYLDTKQLTASQLAVIVEVAKYIEAHPEAEVDEVLKVAEDLSARGKLFFIPDNLEFLRAGGRLSNAAYIGATILNLHPVIELIDGKLVGTKKYRGKTEKVGIQMLKDYTEKYRMSKDILYVIYIVGVTDETKAKIAEAVKELGYKEVHWIQANGVITSHGGPKAFGFAGFSEA
ncbi:MAG: DegV family protein [Dorea sp.]